VQTNVNAEVDAVPPRPEPAATVRMPAGAHGRVRRLR
jgi:hypothetical protein